MLDLVATVFTGSSTWLFAVGRQRPAFVVLAIGACLWIGVALMGSFGGRPIYGMVISSINTLVGCIYGWRRLS